MDLAIKITTCLACLLSSICTYMHLTRLSVIRTQRHILSDVWRCEREHFKAHAEWWWGLWKRGCGLDENQIPHSRWLIMRGWKQIHWEFFLLLRPDNSPLLSLQVICVKLHVLWVGNWQISDFYQKESIFESLRNYHIFFFVRQLRPARHLWTAFADLQECDRNNLFTLEVGE